MTQLLSKPQFVAHLEKVLDSALLAEQNKMRALSDDAGQLATYMRQTIMSRAKRTRPYLFYLVYQGINPKTSDFPWQVAVAVELYHQFLLIHDDVIDHDLVRHGVPNVAGSYYRQLDKRIPKDGERLEMASALAILAGDLCLSLVYELIAQSPLAKDQQIALYRNLHTITEHEIAGQQLDALSNYQDISQVSLDQILTTYDYKTATYTLELPITWALMLSGTPKSQQQLWQSFAEKVGRAYQISDDLIGLFSDAKTTGKPIGGDIREGKKTIILRLAYENLQPSEWQKVQKMLGQAFSQSEFADLLDLFRRWGIYDQAVAMAEKLVVEAHQTLKQINISEPCRDELTKLIDALATRKA